LFSSAGVSGCGVEGAPRDSMVDGANAAFFLEWLLPESPQGSPEWMAQIENLNGRSLEFLFFLVLPQFKHCVNVFLSKITDSNLYKCIHLLQSFFWGKLRLEYLMLDFDACWFY